MGNELMNEDPSSYESFKAQYKEIGENHLL